MKRLVLLIALTVISNFIFAQEVVEEANTNIEYRFTHFSIGPKLDIKLTYEYKVGITATSPYFLNNRLAIRAEADMAVFQGDPSGTIVTNDIWMNYYMYKAGLVISATDKPDFIRPYGELGLVAVFPNKDFTAQTFSWGNYITFGTDFLFDPSVPYGVYFEVSAIGILSEGNGRAERITETYFYANGLLVTFGCRFYF